MAAQLSIAALPSLRSLAAKNVPSFTGDIVVNANGNAVLPGDFLPDAIHLQKDEYFYKTFRWFRYFDKGQRDKYGQVYVPGHLELSTPENVEIWKGFAKRFFGTKFTEASKYCYGLECGKMAAESGITLKGKGGGKIVSTTENVINTLFEEVAPPLLRTDNVGQLVAHCYTCMHGPCVENNNQWAKMGVAGVFQSSGAKVELTDTMTGGRRVHSVVKLFKKYGTQSPLRMFKTRQEKTWHWTLEVNKTKRKDGGWPACKEGEVWSCHNIESFLSENIKRLMHRTGGYEFLIKHDHSADVAGQVFTSNAREAVNRAVRHGCSKSELSRRILDLHSMVTGDDDVWPGAPVDDDKKMGAGEQMGFGMGGRQI